MAAKVDVVAVDPAAVVRDGRQVSSRLSGEGAGVGAVDAPGRPEMIVDTPRPPARRMVKADGSWVGLRPAGARSPLLFSLSEVTAQRAPFSPYDAFRQHGNSTMAYSTLQSGMKYFGSAEGYLAYDTCWGIQYVLGDPVAPVDRYPEIVDAFLRRYPRTCFCQVSHRMAEVLSRRGLFLNEIGCDMELDLPHYDFSGPDKAKLRQAAAKIEREQYTIEELTAAQVDRRELMELCAAWRATRVKQRELRFLVRPLVFDDEPDVRKFYLRDPAGAIVSFVYFDPICDGGRVIGYSPAVKRRSPAAPTGAEEAVTKFAIERFQSEKRQILRLGLIPLFQVEDTEFRHRYLLTKIFRFLYGHGGRWIYSFKGHADFKRRYRGKLDKAYFATFSRFNVRTLLGMLHVCRII